MYIKSPLNYTGGKYKILNSIITMFPHKINTFVDLFAGGFNVGINVKAEKIVCNDHINYLIDLYLFLQENAIDDVLFAIKKIIAKFSLNQTNTDGYLKLRERYNEDKDILDLFILTCFSFNHQIRFNNNRKFNTPFGKERSSYNKRIEENLCLFSSALKSKNIDFLTFDFTEVNLDALTEKDLVYCDPPYLITTSSYNDGKRGFKDWKTKEELQLLALLDKLDKRGIKFALSNVFYHKGLTNEALIDWSQNYHINYIDKSYSNCSYQFKDRNAKTVEVLITNYAL